MISNAHTMALKHLICIPKLALLCDILMVVGTQVVLRINWFDHGLMRFTKESGLGESAELSREIYRKM
jgi:hypothetical protein